MATKIKKKSIFPVDVSCENKQLVSIRSYPSEKEYIQNIITKYNSIHGTDITFTEFVERAMLKQVRLFEKKIENKKLKKIS